MTHQKLQQPELTRLEQDFLRPAPDGAREKIHLQIPHAQLCLHGLRITAACERLDAGEQFGELVRLDQIIIAAGLEALDAIIDLAERGEDEHRRAVALLPQSLDDRQSVLSGHHAIDDEHVEAGVAGHFQALFAVMGDIGSMARLAQALGHEAGDVDVVLDDQYAHDALPAAPAPYRLSPASSVSNCSAT